MEIIDKKFLLNLLQRSRAKGMNSAVWENREKNGIVMAGKYTPLENYLRDLPRSQREVTLRFEQIEEILNSKLPSSAYEDRRWWDHEKEGNHVTARAWANAGWKVESVDVNRKRVSLVRVATAGRDAQG